MKRAYLSGPMSDVKDYDFDFAIAEDIVEHAGYLTCNPARLGLVYPDAKWKEYIDIDLELLKRCDAIVLLKGWENSHGCRIELKFAEALGLEIIKLEDLKDA